MNRVSYITSDEFSEPMRQSIERQRLPTCEVKEPNRYHGRVANKEADIASLPVGNGMVVFDPRDKLDVYLRARATAFKKKGMAFAIVRHAEPDAIEIVRLR